MSKRPKLLIKILALIIILATLGLLSNLIGCRFIKYHQPNQTIKIKRIQSVADFYNLDLTKKHDIRKLPQKYTSEHAAQDGISFNLVSSQKAQNFIQNYKNHQTAFLRTASTTIEGDVIFHDLLYYAPTNQLLVVIDHTRDQFLAYEDHVLLLFEYNGIEIIQDNHNKKLVTYQGNQYNPLVSGYSSLFISIVQ